MSFAEVVFYFVALLCALFILSIVRSLMSGRKKSALMTLRVFLVFAGIYGAFLLATTLAMPLQILPMMDAQYSGDWSISVASMRRVPHDLDEDYEIDFRMTNRGTKALSGVSNLTAYLVSENGTRYDAAPDSSAVPFDTVIQPGKWAVTTRRFVLPTNLNRVELVLARTGLHIGSFVVGRTPFDGHTVIQLQ